MALGKIEHWPYPPFPPTINEPTFTFVLYLPNLIYSRWQWAVNWLKSKMEGNYWTDSVTSNEDSNNRTFHR